MRTQKSIKNSMSGLLIQTTKIIIGLISQSIFIKILGIEYAGITGVLNNIISMLSIAELGVGTAIVFSLYEPLSNKNTEKIKSIMNLYRKTYYFIGIIIAIIGISLLPFLKYFFKDITVNINLRFIYLLYLGDTVFSYFFTYQRSLLYADQKNYINSLIDFAFLLIMNILQITCIITTRNFYYYLIIRIIVHIISYIYILSVINKKYPFIRDKKIIPLSTNDKTSIIKNIKGLFYHKIGGFIVLSTDNLIISSMINIVSAGIFYNYKLISQNLKSISGIIFKATTASFGNLLISEPERGYVVFNKLFYLNFIIATVFTTGYTVAVQSFMKLFAGTTNLFPISVVFVLSMDLYLQIMRNSIGIAKEAAGIFYKDRYVPLWESLVNLVSSIIFVKAFGVAGVMFGTILSTLVSVFISVPYLTYKYVYKKPLYKYYIYYLYYFSLALSSCSIAYYLSTYIQFSNYLLNFFISGFISILVSISIIIIFTNKSKEYKYFKNLFWRVKK